MDMLVIPMLSSRWSISVTLLHPRAVLVHQTVTHDFATLSHFPLIPVQAACLETDLLAMPGGDQTELGACLPFNAKLAFMRGLQLSVSIARCKASPHA